MAVIMALLAVPYEYSSTSYAFDVLRNQLDLAFAQSLGNGFKSNSHGNFFY